MSVATHAHTVIKYLIILLKSNSNPILDVNCWNSIYHIDIAFDPF